MSDKMKEFRFLKCTACGHEWRSSKNTKNPECSKCHSWLWVDTKDLSDQAKVEKMKDEIYSKITIINKLDSYVDKLIESNDLLVDGYNSLKNRVQILEKRPDTPNTTNTKTIKKPNMTDVLDSMG